MKQKFKQILTFLLITAIVLSCQVPVWADDEEIKNVQVVEENTELNDEKDSEETDETVVEKEDTNNIADQEEVFETVVLDSVEKMKEKTVLYVATDGNDSNPGTIDKPLATVAAARDKIRQLKKNNTLASGGAVVYIRGGNYVMNSKVLFTPEDSGTEEAPIVYRNYPDEEVNFIGGAYLSWSDFKKTTDESILNRLADPAAREHIMEADLFALGFKDLPEVVWPGTYSYYADLGEYLKEKYNIVKPKENSSELIINGEGATLARYPNEGSMEIGTVKHHGNFRETDEPMEFSVLDSRVANWTKAEDAILSGTFWHSWASTATPLASVDPKTNSVKAKYPIFYGAQPGQQFIIINLLEEIDMPGEYFIDRKNGKLYVYQPDEEVEEVVYTMLSETMFGFYKASYITLKGLNMKFTKSNFVNIDAGSTHNQIIGCEFTFNTSTGAVAVSGPDNKVYDCYFHDCNIGLISEAGDRATLTRANVLIENNKFERCERLTKTYSPALYTFGCGINIYNNEISDAEHCVIQLGGNYMDTSFNEIYNACMNTDDMGAIYTGGNLTMRGNTFKNNYLHDIGGEVRGHEGVYGMYFDDLWSCADVIGNVFHNMTNAGVYLSGSYNVIDNNIFSNVGTVGGYSIGLLLSNTYGSGINVERHKETVSKMPIHSEVWKKAFPGIENVIDKDGNLDANNYIVATNNVFYNSPDPRVADSFKPTLTMENNFSYKKDPGFYDVENENFLLKEDSVVYSDNPEFEPIPFTRIGRYNERAISRAKKGYVFCTDSPFYLNKGKKIKADKAQAIVENETIYLPLRTAADAVEAELTYEEETENIKVSGGGKLLEFTDGAKEKVTVSGIEYILSKPIVNINGSNYMSVEDIVNIFEKQVVHYGNLIVISDIEELFMLGADTNLLRYLEEQITLY